MSNDNKHTPTPWGALEGAKATTIYGPGEHGPLAKPIARLENETYPHEGSHNADTAFILRAVNSYEAMREALENALGMHAVFGETYHGDRRWECCNGEYKNSHKEGCWTLKARAALALADGQD